MLDEFFATFAPYLEAIPLQRIGDVVIRREFNAVWCGLTLAYFALCLWVLAWRAWPIRQALRRVSKALEGSSKEAFAGQYESYAKVVLSEKCLAHAWREFTDSLVTPREGDAPRIRNTHQPGMYFNEATVVQPLVHARFFDTVPNQLVGLGILGTFLGLAAGVGLASGKLDSADPKEIQEALSQLLNGASLAFMTSIFGLGLSLVFLWLERRLIGGVHRQLNVWVQRLDACVELVTPEQIALEQLTHAKRQTTQLERFNQDLIFALETTLDQKVAQRLVPELEKVVQAIHDLRADRQDSNQALMQRMVEDFSQILTKSAGREMDQVAATLQRLGDRLEALGHSLTQSQQDARNVMDEAARNLRESLSSGSNAVVASLEEAVKTVARQLEEASRELAAQAAGAGAGMRESGQAAAQQIAAALGTFAEGVSRLERMSASQAELAPRLEQLAVGLRDAGAAVLEAHRGFSSSLEPTRAVVRSLESAGERLFDALTGTQRVVEQVAAAGTTMTDHQERLTAAWEDYATRFAGIDQALQRAFERLTEGVDGYTERIREFHAEVDANMSKAIQSLGSATVELGEVLEDIAPKVASGRR
jgi:hypothetical protein